MHGDLLIPQVDLTADDHDRGFKDVDVELRSGGKAQIRIHALPWRDAPDVMNEVLAKKDPFVVLIKSLGQLPDGSDLEKMLQRLTPFSVATLLGVAWALAYGNEFQKKIQAMGFAFLETQTQTRTATMAAEPKPSSSATGSTPPT
jgi:hypothetical protein